ncbi:MAG: hypothetical protein IPM54_04435 [Polyangiaceae bacterium]|nr:hypothetical protein [Polyangiaceae bacterium]
MGQTERQDAEGEPRKTARAVIGDVGAAVQSSVAPVADRVGSAIRSGVGSVERALDDPATSQANELVEKANLPEISGEAPLVSLSIRLDREADFWRGISMRQLSRAAWMDRLSITSNVVLLIGIVVLSAIAAFRAMFASDAALHVSALLGVAALLLVMGSLTIQRATAKVRQGQLDVMREALARSDLAEARIHRLAALIEMRVTDPEQYRTALRELEGDMRGA